MNISRLIKAFISVGLGQTTEQEPEFLQPLDNLTVTQGRDVSFTCVVNNLGQYRVSTASITRLAPNPSRAEISSHTF